MYDFPKHGPSMGSWHWKMHRDETWKLSLGQIKLFHLICISFVCKALRGSAACANLAPSHPFLSPKITCCKQWCTSKAIWPNKNAISARVLAPRHIENPLKPRRPGDFAVLHSCFAASSAYTLCSKIHSSLPRRNKWGCHSAQWWALWPWPGEHHQVPILFQLV